MTSREEEERKRNVECVGGGEGEADPAEDGREEGGRRRRCRTGLRCLALISIFYDAS